MKPLTLSSSSGDASSCEVQLAVRKCYLKAAQSTGQCQIAQCCATLAWQAHAQNCAYVHGSGGKDVCSNLICVHPCLPPWTLQSCADSFLALPFPLQELCVSRQALKSLWMQQSSRAHVSSCAKTVRSAVRSSLVLKLWLRVKPKRKGANMAESCWVANLLSRISVCSAGKCSPTSQQLAGVFVQHSCRSIAVDVRVLFIASHFHRKFAAHHV